MKTLIETKTGNILIVSEPNKHPFIDELKECLIIKFIKEDNKYYIDSEGLVGLIQYMQYLIDGEQVKRTCVMAIIDNRNIERAEI